MAYHENPFDFVKYDVYTTVSHATSKNSVLHIHV